MTKSGYHPRRLQRSRAKGYRMPDGAIYVGRPTKWGNPYRIATGCQSTEAINRKLVVSLLERHLEEDGDRRVGYPTLDEIRTELRGRDLVCWCPLDQPCHADVLLAVANPKGAQPT